MSDLISRQDAINAIENTDCQITSQEWDELISTIKTLPSARPTGEWLEARTEDPCYWICSECKRQVDAEENFCPNCGAEMLKGGEDK